ncbi:amidohydrolase family protein [Pseudoxanthomonas sp. F37]|uniref:amidohydrolase family protein n=1 Tax=Pseudoxanthomonas TaxID=83618 RepID=UPI001FD25E92|nr:MULTISPECIES: amidohydrolase family protein [Pseudoxanthomonas]UOV03640.1 amidohydrolase family protein [Pseudoxanthomonas mexicana]UOV08636.1 amidohydrolase family protein [Pseudoxanthomonas sp. F37]
MRTANWLSACGMAVWLAFAPLAQAQRAAMVGGTLVDGTLSDPIRDSVVLIEGQRIVAVGTVKTLPVPADATVISTEGMTVMPGLWDMHVHLMINGHADYEHWDRTYPAQFRDVIMPASARQLLLAGVTGARDLGGPLEDSIAVRDAINSGRIPGPTLFVSGPFIQKKPYPGTEQFRWGVDSPADARAKIRRIAQAGVDVVKLIDQDGMSDAELAAIVDEAHRHGLPVVAHAHRPEEIRRGLKAGVDCFEHTGLAASPEYPPDVIAALRERTGNMASGPLFWTPTIEGLYNFPYTVKNHEFIDGSDWHVGLTPAIIDDIKQSLEHPERIGYFQQTPQRWPTLQRKFQQLRESGALLLIGTDSGIPMKFHSGSTWNELDVWVNKLGVPAIDAIRAATYWPAVAMKADKDYGTVTEGKYADIIAVKGDVLKQVALLQRVDIVIKHGQRVK